LPYDCRVGLYSIPAFGPPKERLAPISAGTPPRSNARGLPSLPEGLVILEKLSVKIANAAAQAIGMPDRFELKERVDVTCPVCGGTFTLR